MICFICNKTLAPDEVVYNRMWEEWEPCGTCLTIINEVFEPLSEEELDDILTDDTDTRMIEQLMGEDYTD